MAEVFPIVRALIIDPALRSKGGHHYNTVLRLQGELSKLGIGFSCLASAYADREVVADLGCMPTFTKSVYGRDYADAGEFARNVAETSRQLLRALRGAPSADLLILPCCDQVLAMAVARYLKRRRLVYAPHVVLWLLYGPHHKTATDDPSAAAATAECRDAFADLKVSLNIRTGSQRRLQAYCETPAMAAFYRALLDLDVQIPPGPGLVPISGTARAERWAPRPPSSAPGSPSAQGLPLLRGRSNLLRHRRDVTFLIHGIVDGSDAEDEQSTFDRLSTLGQRVVVRQDVLTQEEYAAWLARADLLLLPYDRNVYQSRGSGVFTEAQRLGIPVVATGGCAFAQPAFEGGWGVEIADYSSEGVARAALAALGRLDELTARARIAAHEASDTLDAILGETADAVRRQASGRLAGRIKRLLGRYFGPRPLAIPDA